MAEARLGVGATGPVFTHKIQNRPQYPVGIVFSALGNGGIHLFPPLPQAGRLSLGPRRIIVEGMDVTVARTHLTLVVLAVSGLAVAGCDRVGGPAPVTYGTSGSLSTRPAVTSGPTTIVVQRGDSVHAIAKRYRVPVKAVIVTNGLAPPYGLRIGQSLTLPTVRIHMVQRGDTVHSIARRYQVEIPALVRINDLKPPYTILLDSALAIPESSAGEPAIASAPAPAPLPPPPGTGRAPPSPYSASGKIVSEPLDAPPNPAAAQPAAGAQPLAVAQAPQAPPASVEAMQAPETATEAPRRVIGSASPNIPQPPARGGRAFQWPVAGKVVAKYGSMGEGLQNDGINIAVPKGTPVRAAENGVVVYAGNELKGFGNLLLIKHADGWMTAYAHHDTITVNRGDKVVRGQVVGTVGSSGSATFPQLHFEVRRGVKAVDPMPFMENMKV